MPLKLRAIPIRFKNSAMLETANGTTSLPSGMVLYPAGIKKHRLFLQTSQKQAVGYVSFKDDRLYYILIPLLEQKRAQVKISIAPLSQNHSRRKQPRSSKGNYQDLNFQIRLSRNAIPTFPESIQLQIEALLRSYSS